MAISERDERVATTAGTVVGVTGDGVIRWRSIPYAQPPVGPLRLRAPQPPVRFVVVAIAALLGIGYERPVFQAGELWVLAPARTLLTLDRFR